MVIDCEWRPSRQLDFPVVGDDEIAPRLLGAATLLYDGLAIGLDQPIQLVGLDEDGSLFVGCAAGLLVREMLRVNSEASHAVENSSNIIHLRKGTLLVPLDVVVRAGLNPDLHPPLVDLAIQGVNPELVVAETVEVFQKPAVGLILGNDLGLLPLILRFWLIRT